MLNCLFYFNVDKSIANYYLYDVATEKFVKK